MINILYNFISKNNLIKKNYSGEPILAIGGLFISIIFILIWTFYLFIGVGEKTIIYKLLFLTTIITATGLLDDMAGNKGTQGFKGHFHSLLTGKLTTGFLKVIVTFIVVILLMTDNFGKLITAEILINIAIVPLMSNFINLLDLRPGRAVKFFLVFSVILLIFNVKLLIYFLPIFLFIPFYIKYEFKRQIMLGDCGATTLGAILGFGFTTINYPIFKTGLLIFLSFVTVLSEYISFTEIIKKYKILNWFDELGRR